MLVDFLLTIYIQDLFKNLLYKLYYFVKNNNNTNNTTFNFFPLLNYKFSNFINNIKKFVFKYTFILTFLNYNFTCIKFSI